MKKSAKKKPTSSAKSSRKALPSFRNEAQEAAFWATHSSRDYIDWSKAERATFPELKPSSKTISLRLPQSLLEQYKIQANKRDIPYQSLMKVVLSEALHKL